MNAGKCKIMVSNNCEDSTVITAEGTNVEVVEDFCYPRDAMLARVIAIATCLSVRLSVRVSVRLSVCHAPVLCQNEES